MTTSTFKNKLIDKHSNYNYYSINKNWSFVEVDAERLTNLIKALLEKMEKPYLRFMWTHKEGETDALAVLYDGNKRLTKLLPLSEIEQMAFND